MKPEIYLFNSDTKPTVNINPKRAYYALCWSGHLNNGRLILRTPFKDNITFVPCVGWHLQFSSVLLQEFNDKFPEQSFIQMDNQEAREMRMDINHVILSSLDLTATTLHHEMKNGREGAVIKHYVFGMLSLVSPLFNKTAIVTTIPEDPYVVDRLLKLIAQEAEFKRKPAYFADVLGISQRRLNHICRETIGKHVIDLILEQKLAQAKRLLKDTQLMIKEIAYELDFSSPAYFVRFFNKHTGMQPSVWRRQNSVIKQQ